MEHVLQTLVCCGKLRHCNLYGWTTSASLSLLKRSPFSFNVPRSLHRQAFSRTTYCTFSEQGGTLHPGLGSCPGSLEVMLEWWYGLWSVGSQSQWLSRWYGVSLSSIWVQKLDHITKMTQISHDLYTCQSSAQQHLAWNVIFERGS